MKALLSLAVLIAGLCLLAIGPASASSSPARTDVNKILADVRVDKADLSAAEADQLAAIKRADALTNAVSACFAANPLDPISACQGLMGEESQNSAELVSISQTLVKMAHQYVAAAKNAAKATVRTGLRRLELDLSEQGTYRSNEARFLREVRTAVLAVRG